VFRIPQICAVKSSSAERLGSPGLGVSANANHIVAEFAKGVERHATDETAGTEYEYWSWQSPNQRLVSRALGVVKQRSTHERRLAIVKTR